MEDFNKLTNESELSEILEEIPDETLEIYVGTDPEGDKKERNNRILR